MSHPFGYSKAIDTTEIGQPSSLTEITEACVAIVKFGPAGLATDGTRPAEYYQVTIDPSRVSPSGDFIRFGKEDGSERGTGDEIIGWQRCAALTIVEILGKFEGKDTVLLYGKHKVSMMALIK